MLFFRLILVLDFAVTGSLGVDSCPPGFVCRDAAVLSNNAGFSPGDISHRFTNSFGRPDDRRNHPWSWTDSDSGADDGNDNDINRNINVVSGNGNGNGNENGSNAGLPSTASSAFNFSHMSCYRNAHGILCALAFIVIFPLGAVTLRVVPGQWGFRGHVVIQVLAYVLYIAGAGLGIYLMRYIDGFIPNGSIIQNSDFNYHPIIGIALLISLAFQVLSGLLHHLRFRKLQRRQAWSHFHLWLGRIALLPLGIVNGGLGLRHAGASRQKVAAYTAIAGILSMLWIIVALVHELRRRQRKITITDASKRDQTASLVSQ